MPEAKERTVPGRLLCSADAWLGALCRRLGWHGVVAAAYRRILRRVPDDEDALSRLAQALCELDQRDEAIDMVGRYLERQPDSGFGHDCLGYLLQHAGHHALAVAAFRDAIRLEPARTREASFSLGLSLRNLGEWEAAAAAFRTALEFDWQQIDALQMLGDALVWLDRPADAAQINRRALALAPDVANYLSLGESLLQARQYEDAETVLREGLVRHPKDTTLMLRLSDALAGQDRYDEGLVVARAADASEPTWESALAVGSMLGMTGHDEDALAEAQRAARLAPAHMGPPTALAFAWITVGQPQRALECNDRAQQIVASMDPRDVSPGHVRAHNAWMLGCRGAALVALGRLPEAADAFREAISLEPKLLDDYPRLRPFYDAAVGGSRSDVP